MTVTFITNFCPHYRVKTFELLAKYYETKFLFYSKGGERYWLAEHGVRQGCFRYQYLAGFNIGRTRISPALLFNLLWSRSSVYVKCINGAFALPATYFIARLLRRPFVLWTGVWTRIDSRLHRLGFHLLRHIYLNADSIVVYGTHVKRYLISEGVPEDRIFVTTHAVDNDFYSVPVPESAKAELMADLGIPDGSKVILYLGRLESNKGLTYLIEAFSQLRRNDSCLVFAGTGSDSEDLQRQASGTLLSQYIRFTGYIPPEDTRAYYAIASVFALPSITVGNFKEPWGLVVNEAFNQGVPVVASDSVGAAAGGLVQHGVNGFVVPERSAPALANALESILGNAELRESMSTAARRSIAQWDNEHMVSAFRQAIEYATSGRKDR